MTVVFRGGASLRKATPVSFPAPSVEFARTRSGVLGSGRCVRRVTIIDSEVARTATVRKSRKMSKNRRFRRFRKSILVRFVKRFSARERDVSRLHRCRRSMPSIGVVDRCRLSHRRASFSRVQVAAHEIRICRAPMAMESIGVRSGRTKKARASPGFFLPIPRRSWIRR